MNNKSENKQATRLSYAAVAAGKAKTKPVDAKTAAATKETKKEESLIPIVTLLDVFRYLHPGVHVRGYSTKGKRRRYDLIFHCFPDIVMTGHWITTPPKAYCDPPQIWLEDQSIVRVKDDEQLRWQCIFESKESWTPLKVYAVDPIIDVGVYGASSLKWRSYLTLNSHFAAIAPKTSPLYFWLSEALPASLNPSMDELVRLANEKVAQREQLV